MAPGTIMSPGSVILPVIWAVWPQHTKNGTSINAIANRIDIELPPFPVRRGSPRPDGYTFM